VTTTKGATVLDNHISRIVIDTFEHIANETKRDGLVFVDKNGKFAANSIDL